MFFGAQKELLQEIRNLAEKNANCAINEQRLKYMEDGIQELKTIAQRLTDGAQEQGRRIGDLESFKALIEKQDLNQRITDTQYAVKTFTETMERMESSISNLAKSVATSVEALKQENALLRDETAALKNASAATPEQHKAVFFANMGEKVLIGLMLAAIIGVCTVVWNGMPK